jgi:hypothetical protein
MRESMNENARNENNPYENHQNEKSRGWVASVLTDIQFWVPVAVLIGGLILLRSIH